LDFRGFLSGFSSGTGEFPSDDVFLDQGVFVLLEGEQFSDLVGSFRSEVSGDVQIGKSLDFLFTLLGNCQSENGDVVTHNASTDGFSSTLPGTTGAVTFLVLVQEESYSSLLIYIWKFKVFGAN
jgi:hypothetical protein